MTLIPVHVTCPACDRSWHTATIDPETWWGKRLKAEDVAQRVYCPSCGQRPPMRVMTKVEAKVA